MWGEFSHNRVNASSFFASATTRSTLPSVTERLEVRWPLDLWWILSGRTLTAVASETNEIKCEADEESGRRNIVTSRLTPVVGRDLRTPLIL